MLLLAREIEKTLAGSCQERTELNECADAMRTLLGCFTNDDATATVADEDYGFRLRIENVAYELAPERQ